MNERKGLIQVYTGDGKGKTTAAVGQAIRALGRGFKVMIVQWLKDGRSGDCLLYTSPSPRDRQKSRMPSSA